MGYLTGNEHYCWKYGSAIGRPAGPGYTALSSGKAVERRESGNLLLIQVSRFAINRQPVGWSFCPCGVFPQPHPSSRRRSVT